MIEYWFGFHQGKPRSLWRIVNDDDRRHGSERFDLATEKWIPSETLDRFIYLGGFDFEKTTEEEAKRFMEAERIWDSSGKTWKYPE